MTENKMHPSGVGTPSDRTAAATQVASEVSIRAPDVGDVLPDFGLPPVLTVGEAASFARLPAKAIYRAIARGGLAACSTNRPFRILRSELLRWLAGTPPAGKLEPVASVLAFAGQGRVVSRARRR